MIIFTLSFASAIAPLPPTPSPLLPPLPSPGLGWYAIYSCTGGPELESKTAGWEGAGPDRTITTPACYRHACLAFPRSGMGVLPSD